MSRSRTDRVPTGTIHLGDESYHTCARAEIALTNGVCVSLIGRGTSMHPMIEDGTRMLYEPVTKDTVLKINMPVFCVVRGGGSSWYTCHKILDIRYRNRWYKIGNNHGQVDGWTHRSNIFGRYLGPIVRS